MEQNNGINKFLNDKNKFVLHFYGDRNTGKTDAVKSVFSQESNQAVVAGGKWTYSWITPRYHQANAVFEHFGSVAQGFFQLNSIKDDNETKVESLYRRVDNVKNISVLFKTLRDEYLKELPSGHSNLVLIIDNAENIISFHKFSNLDSWYRHVVEQWQYFLKSLIELNNLTLTLKLIIISNEHILDWGVLDRYRNSRSIGSDHAATFLKKVTKINADVERLVSIPMSNPDKVSGASSPQKNTFAECCKSFHEERHKGYSYFLVKCLNKHAVDINVREMVFLEIMKQDYLDFQLQILKKFNRATSYSDSVKNIQSLISFYSLRELIESCFPAGKGNGQTNGADSGINVRREYFKQLTQMLCLPIGGHIFGDLADCLRRHGYEKILRDMLECIIGWECGQRGKAGISPVLLVRIKMLQGNLLFYPYPEDFLGALRCYADALKTANKVKKCACNAHRCQVCRQLINYEVFNVLYQIRGRKLDKIWSERELSGFNGAMKALAGLYGLKTSNIKAIMQNLLEQLSGKNRIYHNAGKHAKCWEILLGLNNLNIKPESFEHRWTVARLKFECLYRGSISFHDKLLRDNAFENAVKDAQVNGTNYWAFAKAFYHAQLRLNKYKRKDDKKPENFEKLYRIFRPLLDFYTQLSFSIFSEQGEREWRRAKVDELLGDIMCEAIRVGSKKEADISRNFHEDVHMDGYWKKAQEFKKKALEHYAKAQNAYAVLGSGYYVGRVRRKMTSGVIMADVSRRGTRSVPA
ncbi:MAG: hypothetical protein NTX01_02755 [Candidatus Omnitrophica bacterium]|nr:hypothetical protein [Candidatus Omnitrophota bacterium]